MLIRPMDKAAEFGRLRKGEINRKGLITGFNCYDGPIDKPGNFRIAKSYMMVVTGYPSSGKSELLDAILVNMFLLHGWKTLYFSPENFPIEMHICKIAEKITGKAIIELTQEESRAVLTKINSHYSWMDPDEPELDAILEIATKEVKDNGLDCLVIDPWNNVDHKRGQTMVHEYLSSALAKVLRFCRKHNIFCAIVAHPKTPIPDKNGNYPEPDLYSISEGAMWRNKADYGLVVHRPDQSRNRVKTMLQKRKFKWMGTPGTREMDYDMRTGRFKSVEDKEFLLPTEVEAPF